MCRRKLSYFVREFWDVTIAEELEWNFHMEVLCDEVQEIYERVFMHFDAQGKRTGRLPKLHDLVINIPPGTSKTTIVSVMAPAWSWTRDASLRHITGSYGGDLAVANSTKSRDIILSSKYRAYFPEVIIKRDENGKTDYKTTCNGQRLSTSVGAGVTGIHAHIITIDDPLNTKQMASKQEVETANKWFDNTLSTRKVDKLVTPTILIMQRLLTNDPTGHMLEKRKKGLKVRHICLPGTVGDNISPIELKDKYKNGYLDERRLGQTVLDELKIQLGSAGYAGQIDQRPVPAGGLIWQKWFIEVPDEKFPSKKFMTQYGTDWDLAYTKEETNSASAYIAAGKINNKIYIDDIGWRWLEFPKLIPWMKTKDAPHYIEAKASGKSAKQTLVEAGIPAIEIPVRGGDKIARANMATPIAESGMVYIRASMADMIYNDSKQGILFFPNGDFADLADVLAQALQRLSRKGTINSTSGNEAERERDDRYRSEY
jgi:hypothetical protein